MAPLKRPLDTRCERVPNPPRRCTNPVIRNWYNIGYNNVQVPREASSLVHPQHSKRLGGVSSTGSIISNKSRDVPDVGCDAVPVVARDPAPGRPASLVCPRPRKAEPGVPRDGRKPSALPQPSLSEGEEVRTALEFLRNSSRIS